MLEGMERITIRYRYVVEIRGYFEAKKAEMTAFVRVRRKKKLSSLLAFLRRLYL